jgi:hypothetical protein
MLPNGHIQGMGFIRKVWIESGRRQLQIDYAEMLTGDAAVNAAIADGVIQPGEALDNDYYISNKSEALLTFAISDSVEILTTPDATDKPIDWATFLGYWTGSSPDAEMMQAVPWWIERVGATVVSIHQQYLP